ncbi:MAG: aminotransferase class I/II-fold pyridoxal phosphate-dependent enzyme [Alphaproteobacteria bacterium]|nr:aminotransferase class I/II-fold pyridoxal phosphate-dependent enzyme [Alphaproteobacteria bacterium]
MAEVRKPSPATLAAQAMGHGDAATGGVVPAIHPSTTFERDPDYELLAGYGYGRDENPTYGPAEALLAELEGGAAALLFASGMAAATAAFAALSLGDHVVAPEVMYWALRNWLTQTAVANGLEVTLVDAAHTEAIAGAIRPGETKLVWIETPANPLWTIVDIAAAAEVAHAAGARLAVDSTAATPVLCRPIEHGADIVMHSASKYLNGHGDVIGGALVAAKTDEFWQDIARHRLEGGAVLGSIEAWLLQRGMRTLYLRVPRASASALAIAERLAAHDKVVAVHYPGLAGDPGHEVAKRQMQGGFGGMLSIRIEGGAEAALAVAGRLELFKRATSLGGVESLVEHRASVEGAHSPVPPDLLRLSVGIEDPDDLIADLEAALAAV